MSLSKKETNYARSVPGGHGECLLKKKETNLYTTEIILCVGNYYSQECTYAGGVPGGHGECLFDAVGSNGEGRLYHYRTNLLPGLGSSF